MTRSAPAALAAFLLAALPAFASVSPEAGIVGTATYRERVTLGREAVFEAELVDVSRHDVPSQVLARSRRERPGQIPIAFTIAYDPARVEAGRRYVVRTRVLEGGNVRFAGEAEWVAPVRGRGAVVAVAMRAVGGPEAHAEPAPPLAGPGSRLAPFPATFTGLLPCADCAGIRCRLGLLADGSYTQRLTYLKGRRQLVHYEKGAWAASPDGRTLTLRPEGGGVALWDLAGRRTLRPLDRQGRPVRARRPYALKRSD